jgi:excinuclease Cho
VAARFAQAMTREEPRCKPPPKIDPDSLAALPRSPGVYIFRGEGALPLYIGKSVDIRARVMSHLRARDEARMIAQTRRVDFIGTAGEIGALLQEARMIKEQRPLFNIRLRRSRTLCSILLRRTPAGVVPEFVDATTHALGSTPDLYGLFASRHAARMRLRELAHEHALCLALLGLEGYAGRGCFGLQIRRCRGACVGKESRSEHDERLSAALVEHQVHCWPYRGAVDIVEEAGGWVQRHRVHNWGYVGTWCSKSGGALPDAAMASFDPDVYKILVKPIMLGSARLDVAGGVGARSRTAAPGSGYSSRLHDEIACR